MSTENIKLTTNFATPIATCLHPDAEELNRGLRALFMGMADAPSARSPSMRLSKDLYESDFFLFDRGEPVLRELRDFCWSNLHTLVCQLNRYGPKDAGRLRIYGHSWVHVTRQHGFFGMHNHPMVSWSGVYCVDPGDPSPEYPDSGALQFHNPLIHARMYEDAGNLHLSRPFGGSNINYHLQPGLLVLFPSWAVHEVLPYRGTAPRITVAFNCKIDMTDAT